MQEWSNKVSRRVIGSTVRASDAKRRARRRQIVGLVTMRMTITEDEQPEERPALLRRLTAAMSPGGEDLVHLVAVASP